MIEVATIASSLFLVAAFFKSLMAHKWLHLVPFVDCKMSLFLPGYALLHMGWSDLPPWYTLVSTPSGAFGVWIGLLAGLVASSLLLYLRFCIKPTNLFATMEQLPEFLLADSSESPASIFVIHTLFLALSSTFKTMKLNGGNHLTMRTRTLQFRRFHTG
ncbi:MAG: hypothetical protein CM15mP32_4040 [Flavobacteriaceae bacterium]|nr:MAG: hypothetical protein CM15mP32_4040 [Flavobacteriaceae bacterium]